MFKSSKKKAKAFSFLHFPGYFILFSLLALVGKITNQNSPKNILKNE